MKLNEIKTLPAIANVVIIRLADEDDQPWFVQLPIINGIVGRQGLKFTVKEGDSYRELNRCQVAIAHFDDKTKSSQMLYSFSTFKDDQPIEALNLPYNELKEMISDIIRDAHVVH